MHYGVDFLYVSDVFGNPAELINGARTSRRIETEEGPFHDAMESGGCDVLRLEPCRMATDGSVTSWRTIDLRPETAPWFNGSVASTEAFGFYIMEWTGLDGAHHGRSMTEVGAGRGGAYFGPISHGGRVMKLNVHLLGSSERGLNHLFRWLEQTLLDCCNRCDARDIWVREFCPDDPFGNPEEGLARMTRVALVEGPTWEASPAEGAGCFLRAASFTLVAGDPCMYRTATSCLTATTRTLSTVASLASNAVAPDLLSVEAGVAWSCTPTFADVAYGVLAPRVTISSGLAMNGGSRQTLPDLRISAYTNPGALAVGPYKLRKIGELIITGRGTSGLEIVADLAEQSVVYRENTGSSPPTRVDGSRLIGRAVESNLRRWFSVRACDYPLIAVEPVYGDLRNTTEGTLSTATVVTVTIDMVNKLGCC